MKKKPLIKKLIISIGLVILIGIVSISSSTAKPTYGTDPSICHDTGDYTIMVNTTSTIEANTSSEITIKVDATGTNVQVHAISDARDNNLFGITPSVVVADNSANDLNGSVNANSVIITFTSPSEEGSYKLYIIARSPSASTPDLATIEISVDVGAPSSPNLWDAFVESFFNHMNIYLGGIAVICLLVGYILYEIDDKKYTRAHGILAASSIILTTINIAYIIPLSLTTIDSWISNPGAIDAFDYGHIIHMVLGTIGYIGGIIAMITGLGGIRSKKPGLVALIAWGFNFLYGISPLGWGINL